MSVFDVVGEHVTAVAEPVHHEVVAVKSEYDRFCKKEKRDGWDVQSGAVSDSTTA